MPADGASAFGSWLPGGSVLEAAIPVITDLLQVAAGITISDALGEPGTQVDAAGDAVADGLEEAANALPYSPEEQVYTLAHRLTRTVEEGAGRFRNEVNDVANELRRVGRNVDHKLSEVSSTAESVTTMAAGVAASTDDELLKLGATGLAGVASQIHDSVDELQRMLEVDRRRMDEATHDFQRELDQHLYETNAEFARRVTREMERVDWRQLGRETRRLRRRLFEEALRIRTTAAAYQLLVNTVQAELEAILDVGVPESGESDSMPGVLSLIVAAMFGGLFLAAGLAGLMPTLSDDAGAVMAVSGASLGEETQQSGAASPPSSSSDSVALSPWMPALSPLGATVEVDNPVAALPPDPMMPTLIDLCVGLMHGSGMSLIFYDLRLAYVPSGARIGLMSYGPPGGTTPFSGEGALDENGYTRVQFDIFQFGSYIPQMLTIDDGGEITELPGSVLGGTMEVGSPEQACDPADLAPLPPEPEIVDVPATVTASPGGGAVSAPPAASTPSEGIIVTAGSPQLVSTGESAGTSGTGADDDNDTERAIGLGLVAAATAGLATAGNPDLTNRSPRRRRSGSATTPPRTYSAEDRAFLQEIYKGASDAGVNILGLATVGSIDDSLAGSKANPVTIGKAATLYVRMGADGSLLAPRGHSDTAAASILKIDVRPGVEYDSDGNRHVIWHSHVTQIDVETAQITDSSAAGPSTAEWDAKVDERPFVEWANDPEFKDWVVESMPSTPGEAVAQALGGAGVTN